MSDQVLNPSHRVLVGHVLDHLRAQPNESVHCVVTSPPYYGLRDYGVGGQIGMEKTPQEYLAVMVEVFREIRRVLRADGTCWVNMGDSYAGSWGAQSRGNTAGEARSMLQGTSMLNARQIIAHPLGRTGVGSLKNTPGLKSKDLMGMPWRLAFALQDDGWYLRQDIIWAKSNPMPESVRDRCTKAHEYVFLLSKSERYYYDAEAIKEAGSIETHARRGRAQTSTARLEGVPGQSPHSLHSIRVPDSYKGSVPGRKGGPGQDRRSTRDRKLAEPGEGIKSNSSFDEAMSDLVASRNKRSVWTIATESYEEAHFATFPTKLVEPCILAGTSEHGVCAQCGAPWRRILQRVGTGTQHKRPSGMASHEGGHGSVHRDGRELTATYAEVQEIVTVGWKPTCHHYAEVVPATVLDPFSGSGTTGVVALRQCRRYLGIEINPVYAEMSHRRLERYWDNPIPPQTDDLGPLFAAEVMA